MATSINLLPWREALREKNKRFFLIGLGVSAGVAAAVVLAAFFIFSQLIAHQLGRNKLIEAEIVRYDQQILEIQRLKRIREALIARMNVIEQLQENRPEIVHFFDELTNIVPKSIYLLQVERTGKELLITGHTDNNSSVSLFMQNIRRNFWLNRPMLEEVAEVTNTKKTKLYNQFRLKVLLQPMNKLVEGESR